MPAAALGSTRNTTGLVENHHFDGVNLGDFGRKSTISMVISIVYNGAIEEMVILFMGKLTDCNYGNFPPACEIATVYQ